MKIAGTGPVQTNPIRKRSSSGKSGASAFAEQLGDAKSTRSAGGAAQATSVDGLFFLQEVDEDGQGKNRAKAHAEAILDRLDEIRDALLVGSLSSETLDHLLSQVRQQKIQYVDPQLRDILEEIELRAAVELAKLGRLG